MIHSFMNNTCGTNPMKHSDGKTFDAAVCPRCNKPGTAGRPCPICPGQTFVSASETGSFAASEAAEASEKKAPSSKLVVALPQDFASGPKRAVIVEASQQFPKGTKVYLHHSDSSGRATWVSLNRDGSQGCYCPHSDFHIAGDPQCMCKKCDSEERRSRDDFAADPGKPWIVRCRVSGGVTGTRESILRGKDDKPERYATREEAEARAKPLRGTTPRGVSFHYWPDHSPERQFAASKDDWLDKEIKQYGHVHDDGTPLPPVRYGGHSKETKAAVAFDHRRQNAGDYSSRNAFKGMVLHLAAAVKYPKGHEMRKWHVEQANDHQLGINDMLHEEHRGKEDRYERTDRKYAEFMKRIPISHQRMLDYKPREFGSLSETLQSQQTEPFAAEYHYDSGKHPDYVGGWSDDSSNIRDLIQVLKGYGVRAKGYHSPYEGHSCLSVHKDDLAKARKPLREQTGDDFVHDSLTVRHHSFAANKPGGPGRRKMSAKELKEHTRDANAASIIAEEATGRAEEEQDRKRAKKLHAEAAGLHDDAVEAHDWAEHAHAHSTYGGKAHMSDYHRGESDYHGEQAKYHRGLSR